MILYGGIAATPWPGKEDIPIDGLKPAEQEHIEFVLKCSYLNLKLRQLLHSYSKGRSLRSAFCCIYDFSSIGYKITLIDGGKL